MATVKFYLRSDKKQFNTLYVSLSDYKNNVRLRVPTDIMVSVKDWDLKKGLTKNDRNTNSERKETRRKVRTQIEQLEDKIIDKYKIAVDNNVITDTNWIKSIINDEDKPIDESLSGLIKKYIDELPTMYIEKYKRYGAREGTIKRYRSLLNNITTYEKHQKKKYNVKDVDLNWANDYQRYLLSTLNLSGNTTGRYIKAIKTICNYAKRLKIKVNYEFNDIKPVKEKAIIQYLTLDEINKIIVTEMPTEGLINAKQWLIISCFIGQRVGDLLKLTKDNIVIDSGYKLIKLKQQKTDKMVSIPIHDEVQKILDANNGNFPRPISSQKYNKHIKKVAELSGITQKVNGSKINPETNRKEVGMFRKCDLISSHIGRRSLATNFYGEISTPLLMNITQHSTEEQFIAYVALDRDTKAKMLAKEWQKKKQLKLTPIIGGLNKQAQ